MSNEQWAKAHYEHDLKVIRKPYPGGQGDVPECAKRAMYDEVWNALHAAGFGDELASNIAAMAARQPVGVSSDTLRALADRWASGRDYNGSPVDDIRALIDEPTSAHQPVGPKFYTEDGPCWWHAGKAFIVTVDGDNLQLSVMDGPRCEFIGDARPFRVPANPVGEPVFRDHPTHNVYRGSCGNLPCHCWADGDHIIGDEVKRYAAQPAQAVDLGQFRRPIEEWRSDMEQWVEGHGDYDEVFAKDIAEANRLLALIDSQGKNHE